MMRLAGVVSRVLVRRVHLEVREAELRRPEQCFVGRAPARSCEELRWVVPRRRAASSRRGL